MILSSVRPVLGMGAPPPSGQPGPPAWTSLVPLVLLFVLFYFVLLRPQQKKAKEHAQLLKTVKPGDRIVTSGGVVAVVITVKDKTLNVRSADAKLEITKSAIAEITERGGESNQS
jgi:preprotein translocase subunit YajC